MLKSCETNFNLDRHLISFLQDVPFFAELSRHITKISTVDMPTAGVAFDQKNDQIILYWNPEFFSKLTDTEIRGVLVHEYWHLTCGHLATRRKTPHSLWNIATDLAINSLIIDNYKNSGKTDERIIPRGGLIPGKFPEHPDDRDWTEEEKKSMKVASVIATFPPGQSSEWYFYKLMEELKDEMENGGLEQFLEGEIGSGTLDDHGSWAEVPEDMREYVEAKVKSIVEKAQKHADSQSNGWGNIPAHIQAEIRKYVSNVVNWRNVLRQFVGSLVRGGRSTSIKRINKRFPYIHPGLKRGYEAKLLIAIDQSGSVSDKMLVEFFSELGSLTKKVTIDVLPFDCIAQESDIFTWRKGTNPPAKRVRGGGTDFNAPTNLINDTKNRGRWDGMLVMTDGEAPIPGPSRLKRGWVLGKNCKLMFATDELTISMDGDKSQRGSWL